jgi:hypothetical protein
MISKQTSLDLNGPILSFVQQPQSTSVCDGGSATFVGIATATFPIQDPPNPASNTGTLSYRWYADGFGPLTDGTFQGASITGSGTTTLTITNAKSPTANGLKFYVGADYVPSAYVQPVGSEVTVGTGRSTGNAINEVLNSNTASLTVFPVLSVATQPTEKTAAQTRSATFTTEAVASDGSNVSYKWQIGCVDAIDGTRIYTPSCGNIGNPVIDVTNESTGLTTTINLSSLGRYSDFTPGIVYTLVPKGTFVSTLRSVGAKGGNETRAGSTGGLGGLAQGTFTFIENQTYKLMVGGAGFDTNPSFLENPAATASGGGRSSRTFRDAGGGAQGGGYTGLFKNSILQSNSIIIGSGGGGANRDPARGGSGGGTNGSNSGNCCSRGGAGATQIAGGVAGPGGNAGTALKGGDGTPELDGAGGGGGYFGGGGGGPVGGGGGGSGFIDLNLITSGSFVAEGQTFPSDFSGGGFNNRLDGRFEIIVGSGQQVTLFENTITGSNTSSLTISSRTIGTQQISAIITHPTSCSSPIFTNTVNFNVVDARQIITFEKHFSSTATLESINLFNGDYTLLPSSASTLMTFYAPEKDIDIEMDIYSAAGRDSGSFKGGEGGFSRVRFRMPQNVEYTIAGFNFGENPYIYKQSRMFIVVGAGGWAGPGGNGGPGGGVGVGGGNGSGRGGGTGGVLVSAGQLGQNGIFGSNAASNATPRASFPNGGRATGCPDGNYWNTQGFSACQNMGNVQFRLADGTVVSNSAVISRGFKAGRGVRQTAGAGDNGAIGGTGATGGNGGTGGAGAGGGSGYHDGSIEVVQTTLGGNLEKSSRIIVRAIN